MKDSTPRHKEKQAKSSAHQYGEQNHNCLIRPETGSGKIDDRRDADREYAEQADRNHYEFYRSRHVGLDKKKNQFVVSGSANRFDDANSR